MAKKGLMEQDLKSLDVAKLHPLSPEVISRQATINIGMHLIVDYIYHSWIKPLKIDVLVQKLPFFLDC
jgi:hypothetical protein